MNKVITYTLEKGTGEQDLIDLNMKNLSSEIESMANDYFKIVDEDDSDFFIVKIKVERNATKDELDKLHDL